MSLVQTAVARHREVVEREKRGNQTQHEAYRLRYRDLLLSGDDSPQAAQELADLLFFLEDAEPPITPEQVLADAAAIEQAKRLMGLHADLPRAYAERCKQQQVQAAVEYLCEVWPRYQRSVALDALQAYDESFKASLELQHLAERHPLFFDTSGELPALIGTEPASLARERAIEALRSRILRTAAIIREIDGILAVMPADHERRPWHELWKKNREADHAEMLAEFEALTGEPPGADLLDVGGSHESPMTDQESLTPDACPLAPEASRGFITNQQEAAKVLGVSDETWALLKERDGFPARTKQGWDIAAILDWLEQQPDAVTNGHMSGV